MNSKTYPHTSYSSSYAISSGWVAATDGFIVCAPNGGNFVLEIYIDGVQWGNCAGHSGSSHGQPRACLYAPIGKGETFTYSGGAVQYARFVPYS